MTTLDDIVRQEKQKIKQIKTLTRYFQERGNEEQFLEEIQIVPDDKSRDISCVLLKINGEWYRATSGFAKNQSRLIKFLIETGRMELSVEIVATWVNNKNITNYPNIETGGHFLYMD